MLSIAHAQAASSQGSIMSFLPMIAIFAVFYFLLIRPQQKRTKEHRELVAGIQKGDEVLITSGIFGKIVSLDDTTIGLEISTDTVIKVQRQSVASVLPKGTIKS